MTACYAVLVRGLVGVWRPLVATFTAKIVYLILVVILEQRKFKH